MVGLGTLLRLPGGAERGHYWVSYPLPLPSVERWSAWPQGSVGASAEGPHLKPVEDVADCGAVDGGRCLSDG